jgi:2-dehydro-3-deoxyphosphogluconate aldolase / (4S)-4-hydroxy-2-oxoglutarate aldolase
MDATGLPYLPGTSTVSEMLAVAERGRTEMKFFPAEAAGGAPYLASLASPLPQLRFCPTGGITAATAGHLPEAAERRLRRWLLGDAGRCPGRG